MSIESVRQKLGVGTTPTETLSADLNKKGTTQPVEPQGTSTVSSLRAKLGVTGGGTPAVTTPKTPEVTTTPEKTGLWDKYANQVNRKIASFDAGFLESAGQLARSFQWLGDRLVGDRIVQNASDKVLESELKATDDMLKIYRDRKAKGDEAGAKRILEQLKVMGNNKIPYEAYANTTDSVFYKAQDKTQGWADTLKKSAGITKENSTFSDRVFEGAGSSATYFIPSIGVMKGASVLSAVSPRIAMLFGGSAGAGLEAMAEAGSTYDEWQKKGDLQKAGEESTKVFLSNAILLAVTNHLGVFNPSKLGILKRALLSAPTEGLQEAVQQVIQNEANDRPLWEGVLEAGAIGAIIGSVMGGVTDMVTTQTKESEEGGKKKTTTPKDVPPDLASLREKLKVTPAIDQQRAIEAGQPNDTSLPSPTAGVSENGGISTEVTPTEGKGSGLVADVRLPEIAPVEPRQKEVAFKEFEKLAKRVKSLEDFHKKINESDIQNLQDVVQFHGTQSKDLGKALKEGTVHASEDGVIGRGFYVTTTPELADYFGKQKKSEDGKGRTMDSSVTPNIHAIDLRDLNIFRLPYGKQEYYDYLDEVKMSPNDFNAMLALKGYDGLNLEGRGETVIFNTTKVKELPLSGMVKKPKKKTELEEEQAPKKKTTSKKTGALEVGEVYDTKGHSNMKGKVTVTNIEGKGVQFTDEDGVQYAPFDMSTAKALIAEGVWEKVSDAPVAKEDTSKNLPETEDEMIAYLEKEYPDGITLYHQTNKNAVNSIKKEGFRGDDNGEVYFTVETFDKRRNTSGGNEEVIQIKLLPEDYGQIEGDRGAYASIKELFENGFVGADITLLTEIANKYIQEKGKKTDDKVEAFILDSIADRDKEVAKLLKGAEAHRKAGREENAQIYEGQVRDYMSVDAEEFANAVRKAPKYFMDSNIDPFLRFKNKETNLPSVFSNEKKTAEQTVNKADPNIGRSWKSPYGTQTIKSEENVGLPTAYYKVENEKGEIRVYDKRNLEEKIKEDEFRISPEGIAKNEKRIKDNEASLARQKIQDEERKAYIAKKEKFVEWLLAEKYTKLQAGQYSALLDRTYRLITKSNPNGKALTRLEIVEQLVGEGYTEKEKTFTENGKEKKEWRLEKEGSGYDVIKAEYLYAQFLKNKPVAKEQTTPSAEQKKTDLRLELQEKPDSKESRVQTEVNGEKVNRFTGRPQKDATPRVIGQQKPLVTKTDLKTLLKYTPEFKANPVLTVGMKTIEGKEVKVLAWSNEKSSFAIKPSALGLVEENIKTGDQVRVSEETLSRDGQEFRVIKYDDKGVGSKYASIGRYRDDTEMFLSNPDAIKPIQFPELVGLAKELSGNVPFIKKYTQANGMFYPRGDGEIGLNPALFERENLGQLTKTLAHEIGHLVDYLPDHTMSRGNLMGRLNTLRGFMKDFYEPAGQSRTNKELRDQMYELSKFWRPFDETTASPSHLAYRKSAPEIYADFISALFNAPRIVTSMAPTAYNVFFEQLDNKPDVKVAYFELQQFLRTGDITASRRSATKEMFKTTEQESKERQIQDQIEQEMKEKSIWFKFKTQFVDITEAVREDVKEAEQKGRYVNPDDNPTYYLEERNYLGGKIKSEVDTKFNTIYQELQKDGMTWEDLGELMMYERILKGDRQEIANPLGYQPDFVQELMEVYEDVGTVKADEEAHAKATSDMKTTLGEDKYRKLQALAVEYRANLKSFFEQGREEGIYSEDLAKMFEENAFYVPFKGAKYSGVTRTTFGVKHQKGTLGNIENPANTGIEKAVSIIRAIERNKVTRKTIEYYQNNADLFPNEVTEAKTDQNGYPMKPREKDLALVTYMKDGKVKGFYVDKYIADAIQKNTVAEQNLLIGSLRFWNSRLFRPLFITFNLGFQTFNLLRDMKRFWKNIPNMTILKTMKLYGQSLRASKIRAFGLPENPSQADREAYDLINRLEDEQVISITYNDIIKGEDIEDAQIERILREVGVREVKDTNLGLLGKRLGLTKGLPLIKQAFGIMDFIEKTGNMIESLPKIAGVKELEGKMQPREMRSFVRKYVGSPDFFAGGKFKPYANEVFLFSNAIFQGIRSDYEIATTPKSRGAYWLKTAQSELLPKMLMLMAGAGLFGEYLKELFGKVSEYDKTNYTIVPLGLDENGKTIYFRLPSDETGRLIGGMFWKMGSSIAEPERLAELQTYTDMVSYAGGQVPSITPVATAGFNLMQFMAGENPYDFFRQRPVLTDDQQQAGGMERTKPFLTYMFQQLGGNVFMKLYQNETVPKNPSLSESIASLPVVGNIAGRFIKASNYGEVERVKKVTEEVKTEKARENLANRRVVFDYVERSQGLSFPEVQALKKEMIKEVYGGFPKTPEDRRQAKSLEKRFDTLRLRGTADARVDALLTAQSNAEKIALLTEYRDSMSPEAFKEMKNFIIKNRVVSAEVIQALNRVEN